MSDSDKFPKPPPPDDFSKTTPNITISDELRQTGGSSSGWEKTNYNYPAQPPADDWGNTVANYRQPNDNDHDFGDAYSSSSNKPQVPDWGMTQGNINILDEDFGGKSNSSAGQNEEYGATTPYFRLPEAERTKYQNLPPTPTQEAEIRKQEKKEKGGIPSWVWVSGGLMLMFLFAVFVLLIVYVFFMPKTGFEAIVKGAPSGSRVTVDNQFWNVESGDGSLHLLNLKAGKRKIEIIQLNYTCQPEEVTGQDGVTPEPIIAKCTQVAKPVNDECLNIKAGAFDVAEKCANKALDDLSENYTDDDLLRAMNLYIIQFATNKYDIPPKNMTFLERAAGYMKKLPPTIQVEVGGHTDSDGSDENNQILSENRAKAVREALIKFGIKQETLTEKGYGEKEPVATNDNDDGKFQNRRIHYTAVKR